MKKIIMLICLLLAACSPSPESIQKAIEQTQAAIPTSTPQPTNTPQPTPKPTKEIKTPVPNYYIETGFCVLSVGKIEGDFTDVPGCGVQEREQVFLLSNQSLDITFNKHITDRQNFCMLFKLDGTFVMSDLDTTGSGKVTCEP